MSDESMDENLEMDQDLKNIIFNCEEILSNIQLDINVQLFDDLYQEQIYIEMFKKMFPFMEAKITSIEKSPGSTGQKLQQLIDCLSSDVLTMDLTHIRGQAIADKDSRPLINFLQIILELSKLYSLKNDPSQNQGGPEEYEQQVPLGRQSMQQNSGSVAHPLHQANRSSQQFHQQNMDDGVEDQEEPEEGIYREEQDEDDDGNIHHQQQQQQDTVKFSHQQQLQQQQQQQQQRLTKKKSQQNLIQQEDNTYTLMAAPGQYQQDENGQQNFELGESQEQYMQKSLSEEQRMDTEKIQELFQLFKSGLLSEDDPRLEELNYLLQKYGLNLEDILQQEFFNQQHQQKQNGDSTLAQVIKISQSRLERMKNPKSFVESETNNIIYDKQKNYQKFLKDYKRDYERKMSKSGENNQSNINKMLAEERKKRFLEFEENALKKEYKDEQDSLFYQMRDKKVQYLRNIHKIIFELEKKKIIDEQNEYNEKKKQMEEEAKNRLISIENKYKNRIHMLKEELEQKKKDRHIAEVAQKQELSRQERELKDRKRKQIEDLKDLWRSEREKFDMSTKDDRKLENQILELYKKY